MSATSACPRSGQTPSVEHTPCTRSPTQLAIAWALSKGTAAVPLVGARTRAQLAESLGALGLRLSAADLARIEEAIPTTAVAGSRYDEHQMRILDSEK